MGMWILRDAAIWFLLHMLGVYLCHKIPDRAYADHRSVFQSRCWERRGSVYKRWFLIHRWKHYLPDGGQINDRGFAKANLKASTAGYLETFVLETMRAEAIHWFGIASLLVFFLLHPFPRNLAVVGALVILDAPFIMIQRYNRPRLQRIVDKNKGR